MAFSISPTAAEVIRRRLEQSSVEHPVAGMVDATEMVPTSSELGRALSRKASEAELRDIAKREGSMDKLKFHLRVGAYPKSQYSRWSVAVVSGIEIVLPFWVRLALRNWTLDIEDGRFILRNGDRVKHTLMNERG